MSIPRVVVNAFIMLMGSTGFAQNYQSLFENVKVDREHLASTHHGDLSVEEASGRLSINIPLGPGIGTPRGGLKFLPMVRWGHSPQTAVHREAQWVISGYDYDGVPIWHKSTLKRPSLGSNTGASVWPGEFIFGFRGVNGATYSLPDGTSGVMGNSAPYNDEITKLDASSMLAIFGFGNDAQISSFPHMTDQASEPFLRRGSQGELVLGMETAEGPSIVLGPFACNKTVSESAPPSVGCSPNVMPNDGSHTGMVHPTRILVVKGSLAYEFEMVSVSLIYLYPDTANADPNLFADDPMHYMSWLIARMRENVGARKFNFRLKSIRNRFGDKIKFEYAVNGSGYTATLYMGGVNGADGSPSGISVSVNTDNTLAFTRSGVRALGLANSPGTTVTLKGAPINIKYSGIQAPEFTISALNGLNGSSSNQDEVGLFNPLSVTAGYAGEFQPESVTNVSTGEVIQFSYGPGPTVQYGGTTADCYVTPTVLTGISSPGRVTTLTWASYPALPSRVSNRWVWSEPTWSDLPAWFYGVSVIAETSNGQSRVTQHNRTVPIPAYGVSWHWDSTDFIDAVRLPDGQVKATRFVSPLQETAIGPNGSIDNAIINLAFLKHQVKEVRYFASGAYSLDDLAKPPDQSAAFKIESFDGWSLYSVANPEGTITVGTIPYPTRSRSWDKNNQVFTTMEKFDWDPVNRGWKTEKTYASNLAAAPDFSANFTIQPLSVSGPRFGDKGIEHQTSRTFKSSASSWLMGREADVVTFLVGTDATSTADGQSGTQRSPRLTKVFDETYNTLKTVTQGELTGPRIQTQFNFGTSSAALAQAQSVDVTPLFVDAADSVPVGIAAYEYSDFGFMNSIQQKGVAWKVSQGVDEVGRPTSQTDPNSLATSINYDTAGRLASIIKPNQEDGVSLTPHGDSLGWSIDEGARKSEIRYTGFGKLALERRFNGSTWSHRIFGFDAMGRATGATVWQPGRGEGKEVDSGKENLTRDTTASHIEPGHYETHTTTNLDGVTTTIEYWVPPYTVTTGGAPLYTGDWIKYDEQGREILRVDANGIRVATTYGVRLKTIAIGPVDSPRTTHYVSDVLGRLAKVVDPLNNVTEYKYDGFSRITRAIQYPASSGSGANAVGIGSPQVRSWVYDALGRLVVLEQPESGVTYYCSFTSLSKPTQVVYGLPQGWRPASVDATDLAAFSVPNIRKVTTIYDSIGRVTSVSSPDGSVSQVFGYDEGSHGLSNSKLTSTSSEGGILRSLHYGGLNGRLSKLTYTVDSLSKDQSLQWNTDGSLKSRDYPEGATQNLTYYPSTLMPSGASYPGMGTSSFSYHPDHWGLLGITFGNGANSFFDYDQDQVRLKTMKHSLSNGVFIADWKYSYDGYGLLASDSSDVYSYDALGRLSMVLCRDPFNSNPNQGIQQKFWFDAFGNRIKLESWLVRNWTAGSQPPSNLDTTSLVGDSRNLLTYGMNASEQADMANSNHLPAYVNGAPTGASYDRQGNLLSLKKQPTSDSPQLTMSYDALGRIWQVVDPSGNTQRFRYDDQGLRIVVETYQGDPASTPLMNKKYHFYNEARQLTAEYEWVLE